MDSWSVEYDANMSLLAWALEKQIQHFTLLSAICVQQPRLAFQFAKLRFETALADSGLAHSIVRPTAFFKSLSGQLKRVQNGKPFLVFGGGELTRCKPIGEADLARFIRLCIDNGTLDNKKYTGVLPIGGPGAALTPLQQASMLAELLARPVKIRSVSPKILSGTAGVLAAFSKLAPQLKDKAEYARIGHYYATESMLLWDPVRQCYDADGTPAFGSQTLQDSYRDQLNGVSTQDLGSQGFF